MNWREAVKMLGLEYPVELELGTWPTEFDCFPDGYYRREGDLHRIGVCGGLSEEDISRTIWHELTHALQCERDFDGDGERYHAATGEAACEAEDGDGDSPWEAECEAAEDLDKRYRLVIGLRKERY